MKKKLIILSIMALISLSSFMFAAPPVIFFSDLIDGPKTGWNGSATKGCAVTIWGKNFGSIRGANYVTVAGIDLTSDTDYAEWGETANNARGLERITFWLKSSCNDGTGTISVTVNGATSETLPFYVRNTGSIYFVSKSDGDNSYNGEYDTFQSGSDGPWETINYGRTQLSGGDILYIRNGTYDAVDSYSSILYLSPSQNGASNNYTAFIGYPEEFPVLDGTVNQVGSVIRNCYRETGYTVISKLKTLPQVNTIRIQMDTIGHYRLIALEIDGQGIYPKGETRTGAIGTDSISYFDIFGCHVHHWGYNKFDHGIYIGTWDSTQNIEYYDIGWNEFNDLGNDVSGIYVHPKDSDSTVPKKYADEIDIHDNLCYNLEHAGIHIASRVEDIRIYNNIIYNCGSDLWRAPLYFTPSIDHPSNILVYNNTIYSAGYASLLYVSSSANVTMKNNILYSLDNTAYSSGSGTPFSDNDLWYGNGAPPTWASNAVSSDPLFNDPGNADFSIQSTSPAIDAGCDTTALVKGDYDGLDRPQNNVMDIGVYEYEVTPTAPPSAPNIISIESISSTMIDLEWENVSSESSYTLFRNLANNPGTAVSIAGFSVNKTTYLDTGLTPNTPYYYWVKAYNIMGDSDFSTVASNTTLPSAPPSIPQWVSITAISTDEIELVWKNIVNETSYTLFRNTENQTNEAINIAGRDSNVTNCNDTGLSHDTTYYYWLKAYNEYGASGFSTVGSDTTFEPSNISNSLISHWKFDEGIGTNAYDSIGNNDGTVKEGCLWTSGRIGSGLLFNGANSFVEVPHSESLNIDSEITISAWVKVPSVDENKRYIVFKNDLWGIAKNTSKCLYGYTKINGAEKLIHSEFVLPDNEWVHVAYTFNGNVMQIYANGNLQGTVTNAGSISTSSGSVRIGMHDNQWYWNGIIDEVLIYSYALSETEISNIYNSVSNPSPPSAPQWVSVTAVSTNQIDLQWNDLSNESSYTLFRSFTNNSSLAVSIAGFSANQINCYNIGLAPNTTYYYWLKAYNEYGASDFSTVGFDTTLQLPPPDITTIINIETISSSQINLTWKDVSNENAYMLFRNRMDNTSTAENIAVLSANVTKYSDKGLDSDTTYYYWIKGKNEHGTSDFSKVAHAKTFALCSIDLENLIVGPSPYKPNDDDYTTGTKGEGIIFWNLTKDAEIEIYTINGQLIVKLIENDGDGKYVWIVPNSIASGVYICRITNSKGEKKIRKIVIIK